MSSISSFFSFLGYLDFRPDFFDYVGKRLDQKVKVIFKTYMMS